MVRKKQLWDKSSDMFKRVHCCQLSSVLPAGDAWHTPRSNGLIILFHTEKRQTLISEWNKRGGSGRRLPEGLCRQKTTPARSRHQSPAAPEWATTRLVRKWWAADLLLPPSVPTIIPPPWLYCSTWWRFHPPGSHPPNDRLDKSPWMNRWPDLRQV